MHRLRVFPSCILALAFAVLVACSGAVAPNGGTSCTADADCGTGFMCGFAAADGCQAVGACFAAPAPSSPRCGALEPGCACDGSSVNLACNGYPSGYAAAPVLHTGVCAQGVDAGSDGCTGDCDAGGVDASAASFSCGSSTCQGGSQICEISEGGPAGAPPRYACAAYPPSCTTDPSCACVEGAVHAQLCSESAGDFTVTFELP